MRYSGSLYEMLESDSKLLTTSLSSSSLSSSSSFLVSINESLHYLRTFNGFTNTARQDLSIFSPVSPFEDSPDDDSFIPNLDLVPDTVIQPRTPFLHEPASDTPASPSAPSSLTSLRDNSTTDLDIWTPDVIFRVSTISVVMVLTLVGNIALIAVITCHASLRRKRVSIFLLNLAVGDLLVCLFTMTSEILFVAFGEWVLGAAACKLIVYGQIVTLASTTFLLTAMSIDRYQVSTDWL